VQDRANKRTHRRTRGRVLARYGVDEPSKTAFTMNLSLGGAFLRTNNVLRPGTTIQVELEFPDQKFTHWAQVVWAKRVPPEMAHLLVCGMGVRFINPGPDWAEFLGQWQGARDTS
jgi:hypothetical protein